LNNFRSQCGEDEWLAANWQTLGLPDVGFFVDAGAADGETSSNTYWLEKERGWRGLLVEPDLRHEIDRPKSIIERYAIGQHATVSLARCVDPFLNSTLRDESVAVEHERLAVVDRIDVESVPISWLLEKHAIERVDFISIDTEGTEIEAWKTLDLNRWRPKVAIIEYSTWALNDNLRELTLVLAKNGYERRHTTTYNGIFVDVQSDSYSHAKGRITETIGNWLPQ